MAWGIEESHFFAGGEGDAESAYVLGYPTSFGGCDAGFAEGVEEGCFAVVDVAHYCYDGGTEGDSRDVFRKGSEISKRIKGLRVTGGINRIRLVRQVLLQNRIRGQSETPFHHRELLLVVVNLKE